MDLIDRQAAINLLKKWSDGYRYIETETELAIKEFQELPSAQPDLSSYSDKLWRAAYERGKEEAQPHWIPVTERLPEYGLEVVTVDKDGEYEINCIIDEEDGEWNWEKPIAWIPLPERMELSRNE